MVFREGVLGLVVELALGLFCGLVLSGVLGVVDSSCGLSKEAVYLETVDMHDVILMASDFFLC